MDDYATKLSMVNNVKDIVDKSRDWRVVQTNWTFNAFPGYISLLTWLIPYIAAPPDISFDPDARREIILYRIRNG